MNNRRRLDPSAVVKNFLTIEEPVGDIKTEKEIGDVSVKNNELLENNSGEFSTPRTIQEEKINRENPVKETADKKSTGDRGKKTKKRAASYVVNEDGEDVATYQIGYYVTEVQDKALAIMAIEENSNKSELVRRALDMFLKDHGRL